MSEKEIRILTRLGAAIAKLEPEVQEKFLIFGEGMSLAANQRNPTDKQINEALETIRGE